MSYLPSDRTTLSRGCRSFFIRQEREGIKCYGYRDARDRHYRLQRVFHKLGMAPAAWFPFSYTDGMGREVYAFYTELADCWNYYTGGEGEGRRLNEAQDLREGIRARYGSHWNDAHAGNIGYIDGRVVIVDCDPQNFSPIPTEWQDGMSCIILEDCAVHAGCQLV